MISFNAHQWFFHSSFVKVSSGTIKKKKKKKTAKTSRLANGLKIFLKENEHANANDN